VKALPGNPYDGHTLETVIPEMETQIGANLARIVADRGYRGHNAPPDHKRKVYISQQKRGVTEAIRRDLRQRSAVEPVIGHAKSEHRMAATSSREDLREIWLSPNRGAAEAAMTTFAEKYAPKYDKAVECLIKDRQTLLMFFNLPTDHWDHLRTSNPIESVFATVRHRTARIKGALSQDTARLMVFKLVMAASRTWRRLQGQNQLPKVVSGIKFKDGIEAVAEIKSAA
jgi:transposase-like protein